VEPSGIVTRNGTNHKFLFMHEILSELAVGGSFNLDVEKLPNLWEYCKSQPDLYSFRYEYDDKLVRVTLTARNSIQKIHEHE